MNKSIYSENMTEEQLIKNDLQYYDWTTLSDPRFDNICEYLNCCNDNMTDNNQYHSFSPDNKVKILRRTDSFMIIAILEEDRNILAFIEFDNTDQTLQKIKKVILFALNHNNIVFAKNFVPNTDTDIADEFFQELYATDVQ